MNRERVAICAAVIELLESDESDIELVITEYLATKKQRKKRISIINYVNNTALLYSPDEFKGHFRLNRNTFEHLLGVLAPHLITGSAVGRPCDMPEKQLLITLSLLANQEVFRSTSEKYNVSKSTARSYLHKICGILVKLSGQYIKWPTGPQARKTTEKFRERQGFIGVLGCIDGSHIPISAPANNQAAYCNRNKYHSIILQAVCDANYLFTDVFTGYPGSVHDARVFRNSHLGKRMEDNPALLFPNNSHILGDSAYRNTNFLLTPFRDNGHLTRVQKQYNFKHSSTRVHIEQSFGLLKGRFRILKHVNIYKINLIPPLILACCVLHNICMYKDDFIEADLDRNDEPPTVPYNATDNTGLTKRSSIANILSNS